MRWPARGHSARPTGISWTTSPTSPANIWSATTGGEMVRPAGVEPATLGLEVRCSIQLSYGRVGRDGQLLTGSYHIAAAAPHVRIAVRGQFELRSRMRPFP